MVSPGVKFQDIRIPECPNLLGIQRFCADIKLMMGIETGWYWRLCWRFVTPGLMAAVLIYMLLDMSALTYKGVAYPALAHGRFCPI